MLLRYDHRALLESHPELDRVIAQRWFALREGVLSETHMGQLLANIEGQLCSSGAMARDEARWGLYIGTEKTIAEFLQDRLGFLDDYYSQKLA